MRTVIEALGWLLLAALFLAAAAYTLLFTDASATAIAVGAVTFCAMARVAVLEARLHGVGTLPDRGRRVLDRSDPDQR